MTRTDVIPQPLALRLQLAAIRGREPAGSLFEIRSKLDSGGMRQSFYDCRQLDPLLETIARLGRRTDVYIGAAPRTRRQGGRDSIARLWTLWADVDGADALERLRAFKPAPHMIVASGSPDSRHAWWDLREPASPQQARTGEPPARASPGRGHAGDGRRTHPQAGRDAQPQARPARGRRLHPPGCAASAHGRRAAGERARTAGR